MHSAHDSYQNAHMYVHVHSLPSVELLIWSIHADRSCLCPILNWDNWSVFLAFHRFKFCWCVCVPLAAGRPETLKEMMSRMRDPKVAYVHQVHTHTPCRQFFPKYNVPLINSVPNCDRINHFLSSSLLVNLIVCVKLWLQHKQLDVTC